MSKVIFDNGISIDGFFAGDKEVQATQLATMDEQFTTGCINKKHFGKKSIWKAMKNTVQTVN